MTFVSCNKLWGSDSIVGTRQDSGRNLTADKISKQTLPERWNLVGVIATEKDSEKWWN